MATVEFLPSRTKPKCHHRWSTSSNGSLTFAGFSVRLQGEADGAAAAHPCGCIFTRPVAAPVVDSAGLCFGELDKDVKKTKHTRNCTLRFLTLAKQKDQNRNQNDVIKHNGALRHYDIFCLKIVNQFIIMLHFNLWCFFCLAFSAQTHTYNL